MKSSALTVVCLLGLVGAVGGVFTQRQALAKFQAAHAQLTRAVNEVQRLTAQNAELDRLRAEVREIEKLRNETRELHKLRNEVRQLREQKPEWDKLRADHQRLQAGAGARGGPAPRVPEAASLIAKENLSDAGFGSPEATLRTFFWAMRQGDPEKVRGCFLPGTPDNQLPGSTGASMGSFNGLRVVARKAVSSELVKLGIEISTDGETSPTEFVLPFKRLGNEWKIELGQR